MLVFLLRYAVLALAGLMLLDLPALQPAVDVFCRFLAQCSALIISPFYPELTLNGALLRHGQAGFGLEVAKVCSGLNSTWIFVAAVVAFRAPWRARLKGIVVGVLLIQSLNMIRLISLFYLGPKISVSTFNLIHTQVWPSGLLLGVLLLFIGWLLWSVSGEDGSAAAAP